MPTTSRSRDRLEPLAQALHADPLADAAHGRWINELIEGGADEPVAGRRSLQLQPLPQATPLIASMMFRAATFERYSPFDPRIACYAADTERG